MKRKGVLLFQECGIRWYGNSTDLTDEEQKPLVAVRKADTCQEETKGRRVWLLACSR